VDPAQLPETSAIADAFAELADNLKRFGCELLILEMMYNPVRVPLALTAAQATGLPIWFGLSARADAAGEPISFDQLEMVPLSRILDLMPEDGIDVAGVMHTAAPLIAATERQLRRRFNGPLMAYPDSGYFEMPDWKFVDVISEERFEAYCLQWLQQGVQLLGGCCGLTPGHIRAAARARLAFCAPHQSPPRDGPH
jgi:homocysteine S-methyltransferase